MSAAVRIVVPGDVPRKNRRKGFRVVAPRGRKPFITHYMSEEWKDWVARLAMEVDGIAMIDRGPWSIHVDHYTDRMRHLDGDTLHVAHGDVDSATSAVLDGLIEVGVIDDDARFIAESARKHYDKSNPRTEITITPAEQTQLDLAATVTPAPATPRTRKPRAPKATQPDPKTLTDF